MDTNTPNWPQDGFGLKTLSDNGKPPKSRCDDANQTFQIVSTLLDANKGREEADARVQSMFDGNPPYNSSKLKNAGQSRRANFNTLEGPAQLSAGCAPYYDLFASGKHYAVIQCEDYNPELTEHCSNVITEEMDRLLENYGSFDFSVWSMINDFLGFGKGFLMWEDTLDWRFKRIAHWRVLVPDATECDIEDEFELFVVIQDMAAHKLYNRIRNESSARELGWDVSECKEAIRRATPKQVNGEQDAIEIQNQLRDHDLSTSMRMPSVQVAHVYVREFNGKWSHFIIERTGQNKDKKFLYKKVNKFTDASEVIAPFFFEVKSGSWHGATGLGKDIYVPMIQKSRLRCSMLDATFLKLGITFQAKTAAALQKAAIVHIGGGCNVVGPDFDIQQSTILGDIETAVGMNRDLDAMLEANTGIYRPRLDPKPGNPMTLGEFQQRMSMASVLGNSAVNRFYSYLDAAYKQLYYRISNPGLNASMGKGARMALEFQARCIRRGVPKEALRMIESIKSDRNMGNGSATMRQQALGALMPFFPMLNETGRANFIDDAISVYTNEAKVQRYNPKPTPSDLGSDQQAFAMLQVSSMHDGIAPVVTATQNPVIFAQTFLQAGSQALDSVQQGGDPHEILAFLELIGPAIAAHLQRMAQDPSRKDILNTLEDQWKQLAQGTDKLRKLMEQQAEQQQKQQQEMMMAQQRAGAIRNGTDPDTVIKQAELENKIKLDTIKTRAGLQHKDAKAQQSAALAVQKLTINDMSAAAKLRIQKETADAKTNGE
jgi:hypothetical protein